MRWAPGVNSTGRVRRTQRLTCFSGWERDGVYSGKWLGRNALHIVPFYASLTTRISVHACCFLPPRLPSPATWNEQLHRQQVTMFKEHPCEFCCVIKDPFELTRKKTYKFEPTSLNIVPQTLSHPTPQFALYRRIYALHNTPSNLYHFSPSASCALHRRVSISAA